MKAKSGENSSRRNLVMETPDHLLKKDSNTDTNTRSKRFELNMLSAFLHIYTGYMTVDSLKTQQFSVKMWIHSLLQHIKLYIYQLELQPSSLFAATFTNLVSHVLFISIFELKGSHQPFICKIPVYFSIDKRHNLHSD